MGIHIVVITLHTHLVSITLVTGITLETAIESYIEVLELETLYGWTSLLLLLHNSGSQSVNSLPKSIAVLLFAVVICVLFIAVAML